MKKFAHPSIGAAVAAVAVGALLLAACGDDSDDGGAADDATTTTAAAAETTPAATDAGTTPPAASDMTIALMTSDTLGDVLIGANGMTVYLFEKDNGLESACTGGCADNWPPVMSESTPAAGDGVDASKLGVSNGQVTYNGHLLYYFAGDLVAGDMNGVGIPEWYPVTPAGDAAE